MHTPPPTGKASFSHEGRQGKWTRRDSEREPPDRLGPRASAAPARLHPAIRVGSRLSARIRVPRGPGQACSTSGACPAGVPFASGPSHPRTPLSLTGLRMSCPSPDASARFSRIVALSCLARRAACIVTQPCCHYAPAPMCFSPHPTNAQFPSIIPRGSCSHLLFALMRCFSVAAGSTICWTR